ncbi:MAG: diguanylate cyclase, partial [Myxococcales bacterium]|nr:diguanylate cyclase [Myxococcales bacterium]
MPQAPPETLPAQDTVPDPPKRVQILLVEDDPDFVLVLRHLLDRTPLQYSVVMAYSVAEIGSRPLPVRPQVAVVDQILPDGEAADAINRIEATWPGVPVLVLTAHADPQNAVSLMKRGAYDYLQKDELDAGRLTIALEHALERCRLASDLAAAQARLRDWAIRDELTGLYNRRHARTRLDEELARAVRHRHPLTVLMADLDHFKTLNDTFGHRMGDEALREVARVLQAECRAEDLVARYGGEEFLVVLPDTPGEGGELTADRIRAALAQVQVRCDGERARMTVSIGVASLADVSEARSEVLIQAADRALYAAKRAGRDR